MKNSVLTVIMLVSLSTSSRGLELVYNPTTESTHDKSAELKCEVVTELDIKEVIWKRIDTTNENVYYFEPPRYDTASSTYEGRASLSSYDNSSLILSSIQLSDEGTYQCNVKVWNATALDPTILPEEESVEMQLIVNVPPSNVKMTSLVSGKNLTLTCVATDAKPAVSVSWQKTSSGGASVTLNSSNKQIETHDHDDLVTTHAHRYFNLGFGDDGSEFSCIVNQPKTNTTIVNSVTTNSPVVLQPSEMEMDMIPGGPVMYSQYSLQSDAKDDTTTAGLVKIDVDPGTIVPVNTTVVMVATTQLIFPAPSYSWWSEDSDVTPHASIATDPLTTREKYYCMVENAVGRVVLSVTLDGTGNVQVTDTTSDFNATSAYINEDGGMPGFVIAAIVMGSLLGFLLISLTIWYCTCRNPPNEESSKSTFTPIHQQNNSSEPTATVRRSNSKSISTQTLDRDTEAGKAETVPLQSSSRRKKKSSSKRKKDESAIAKHLHDFDENASYLDEYGSRFGINDEENKNKDGGEFEPLAPRSRTTTAGEQDYLSAHSGPDSDHEHPQEGVEVYKVSHSASEEEV